MDEAEMLLAVCPKCHHNWNPYGNTQFSLPYTTVLSCPSCAAEHEFTWHDNETSRLLERKKLGLLADPDLKKIVDELMKRVDILERKLDIEPQARNLIQAELANMKEWARKKEKDFIDIEIVAQEEYETYGAADGK